MPAAHLLAIPQFASNLDSPAGDRSAPAVPSPAAVVATGALAVAAATSVVRCLHDALAFDASTIGEDAASAARRRFAALRAELPPAASVQVVVDERDLAAADLAMFDVCAVALHQRLTTGADDPVPGIDAEHLRHVAEGSGACTHANRTAISRRCEPT